MTLVLAHPGHWLADLMYVAPVIIVVGWIGVKSVLDRRRDRAEDDPGAEPGPGPGPTSGSPAPR